MKEKLESHDKEIKNIKSEFGEFKRTISKKIDDLMIIASKPILTDKQIISIIVGVVVYIILAVSYINKIDARSINNESSISKQELKDEKIMDILMIIKEDVSAIKAKNENHK